MEPTYRLGCCPLLSVGSRFSRRCRRSRVSRRCRRSRRSRRPPEDSKWKASDSLLKGRLVVT